jgi:hypothetical protein
MALPSVPQSLGRSTTGAERPDKFGDKIIFDCRCALLASRRCPYPYPMSIESGEAFVPDFPFYTGNLLHVSGAPHHAARP